MREEKKGELVFYFNPENGKGGCPLFLILSFHVIATMLRPVEH